MKRIIFMLLGCAVLALTSCTSKTESIPTLTNTEIVGSYTGSTLTFMVNGAAIPSSTILVEGTAMNDMTIKLPAGIAGSTEVTVKPVVFSQAEGDVCKLTGATQANGYDVILSGIVLNKKLSLNAQVVVSNYKPSDYVGKYDAAAAAVKVSGVAYDLTNGQAIEISGTDLKDMTVKVPAGVVPGETGELVFSKVAFTADNYYDFMGTITNEERTLTLKGDYSNAKISVSITPEYKTALVGVWNFEAPNVEGGEDKSRVMFCNVETPTGKVKFFGAEQDAAYMDVFFNGLIGQMLLRSFDEATKAYTGAIQNITFHADGNLTAEYNNKFMAGIEFIESPMGAMRWYMKGGKLFLVPNLNMMTKGISSDGLPLEITLAIDGNKVSIFATKAQIMPAMSLLNPIIQGLPDALLGDMSMLVKMLVGELAVMTQEATKFDLGVCFVKAK